MKETLKQFLTRRMLPLLLVVATIVFGLVTSRKHSASTLSASAMLFKEDYVLMVKKLPERDVEVIKKTLETHGYTYNEKRGGEENYRIFTRAMICNFGAKNKILFIECSMPPTEGDPHQIYVTREYVPTIVTTLDGIYYYYDSLPEAIEATVNRLKKMLRGEEQNRDAAMPCSNYTPG